MSSTTGTTANRDVRTHYRACHLCEAICGLQISVQQGKIVSIKGDKDDPLSHGHICPKAIALQDIQEDPDRLRKPTLRTAKGWQDIEWDDAYELIATKLLAIHEANGNAGVVWRCFPKVHES